METKDFHNKNVHKNEELRRAYEALKNYQSSPIKEKGKYASLLECLKKK